MISLPQEYRHLLEEQLDEYLESVEETSDATGMVQDIMELLQSVAGECEVDVRGGDIVAYMENEGEIEDGLFDILLDELEEEDLEDFTAEDLIALLEKIVEIEWVDEDEESFGVEELDEDLGFDGTVIDDLDDDF
jgi:hypothetical protein